MRRWPNFFIVGGARSGTTSLYEHLKQFESIFLPSIQEPRYFSPNVNPDLFMTKTIRSKDKYLALYKDVKDEIAICDCSPTYLWDKDAPYLIHEQVPDAKIMMILRNPVERAYSHYLELYSIGTETDDFKTVVNKSLNCSKDYSDRVIDCGRFAKQVQRYIDVFKRESIKIIIFEEFIKNTKQTIIEVLDFLNIDSNIEHLQFEKAYNQFVVPRNKFFKSLIRNNVLRKLGKNILPRNTLKKLKTITDKPVNKPKMDLETRKQLEIIYQPDILFVENLLGQKLPWH